MSLNRLKFMAVAGWLAIFGAALGIQLTLGIRTTLASAVAVALLSGIPAMVMFTVFRGAGPRNVTQMLYDLDREPSRKLSLGARPDRIDPTRGEPRG